VIESFITVAGQVVVLFLLIGVGFVLTKLNMLKDNAVSALTDIALYVATPTVIIRAFCSMEYTPSVLTDMGWSFLVSFAIHVIFIGMSILILRGKEADKTKVTRFAVIFSNAGFMSLPLQEALLGKEGVFHGAIYVAVFNIILWTWGIVLMSGDKSKISFKKFIFNPGLVGVVVGAFFLMVPLPVPEVFSTIGTNTVNHLANLNTPVPMIVIGYYLANSDVLKALKDKSCYLTIFTRLVLLPLVVLALLYLVGIRGAMLTALTIAASAPTAAATTMFAAKFGGDTELSVNIVSLSTILSVITMPLIVSLAQFLA
jgi:predicted permease